MSANAPIDAINRRAWKSADSLKAYAKSSGWSDRGEQKAINLVAPEAKGKPILDIGVGGGRTVPLLTSISTDYIGIDYTPELVTICRARFPQAHVEHMDARDLSAFADVSFFLVVFSFNGIDAVNVTDRARVLKEIHRVLMPGGLLVFSAHNQQGPLCGEKLATLVPRFALNPARFGWRVLRSLRRVPTAVTNYFRHASLEAEGQGWSIKRSAAHKFGIVIVYSELGEQKRQLEEVGFRTETVYGDTGVVQVADTGTEGTAWFHFVARKVGQDARTRA